MNIGFARIAPDGEIGHGESHRVGRSEMMHQGMLVDKSAAVVLKKKKQSSVIS